jgi:hypothetical protein
MTQIQDNVDHVMVREAFHQTRGGRGMKDSTLACQTIQSTLQLGLGIHLHDLYPFQPNQVVKQTSN